MAAYKNLRWKTLTIVAVVVHFRGRRCLSDLRAALRPADSRPGSMAKQLQARARPQGRRPPRDARQPRRRACGSRLNGPASSCARRCTTAGVSVGAINVTSPTTLPRRGRAAGQGRRVPPHRRRTDGHELRTRVGRRRRLRLHDAPEHRPRPARADDGPGARHHRPPRERARRRRAEHRARTATTAISCWCSCRASPTSRAPRTSSSRPALLEIKLVEGGPGAERARRCCRRTAARCRPTWKW